MIQFLVSTPDVAYAVQHLRESREYIMAHDDKTFRWPGEPASDTQSSDEASRQDESEVLRNWLNRSPSTRRRASFDPALYTWKGYRQWKSGVDKHWAETDD